MDFRIIKSGDLPPSGKTKWPFTMMEKGEMVTIPVRDLGHGYTIAAAAYAVGRRAKPKRKFQARHGKGTITVKRIK